MGTGQPRVGTIGRNGAQCLLSGSPIGLDYIRAEGKAGRIGTRLIAIVAEGTRERVSLPPTEEHEQVARLAQPKDVPETDLPAAALGFRVQNYGMRKHRDLFTDRQLAAHTAFSALVGIAHRAVLNAFICDQAYADAVATYLGFAVARIVDPCCNLATWSSSPKNELVIGVFRRQALSMTWDFAEAAPLADSSGSFEKAIHTVARCLVQFVAKAPAHVRQQNAEAVPTAGRFVFSTDPPYYDNVPYADLSDFFYVWLRRCLAPVYPDLLGTVLVPKSEELVADPFRHGGKEAARRFFEEGMGRVFSRLRAASDPRFPTTIYYAFKQEETDDDGTGDDDSDAASDAGRASTGWETFLQGLVDAGWQIDGTWPMRTERGARTRSIASNALASSIVLVCRIRPNEAASTSRRDFLAALKRELPEALRNLQKGNIAPVDLAQAAIGPGMAVFSRHARVVETDGSPMSVRTALGLINQVLDEVLAEQEGEFDADTRWAIAWFEQSGFDDGPFGVAETLSKAKNTSVNGMVDAGLVTARAGKVRLLRRDELPADWDPTADKRLTIWECTHQLIRALDAGEEKAADLLRKLGTHAEASRDLSYRLYSLCERRKWAQDAIGYNTLVLSWSDLKRTASQQRPAGPTQGEFL